MSKQQYQEKKVEWTLMKVYALLDSFNYNTPRGYGALGDISRQGQGGGQKMQKWGHCAWNWP